jgi:hypothetical protein
MREVKMKKYFVFALLFVVLPFVASCATKSQDGPIDPAIRKSTVTEVSNSQNSNIISSPDLSTPLEIKVGDVIKIPKIEPTGGNAYRVTIVNETTSHTLEITLVCDYPAKHVVIGVFNGHSIKAVSNDGQMISFYVGDKNESAGTFHFDVPCYKEKGLKLITKGDSNTSYPNGYLAVNDA